MRKALSIFIFLIGSLFIVNLFSNICISAPIENCKQLLKACNSAPTKDNTGNSIPAPTYCHCPKGVHGLGLCDIDNDGVSDDEEDLISGLENNALCDPCIPNRGSPACKRQSPSNSKDYESDETHEPDVPPINEEANGLSNAISKNWYWIGLFGGAILFALTNPKNKN